MKHRGVLHYEVRLIECATDDLVSGPQARQILEEEYEVAGFRLPRAVEEAWSPQLDVATKLKVEADFPRVRSMKARVRL